MGKAAAQRTESARSASTSLLKLMSKVVGSFKIVSTPTDTDTIDEYSIHNTVSIVSVMRKLSIIQGDKATSHCCLANASKRPKDPLSDKTTSSTDLQKHTYPLDHVLRHAGAGENIYHVVCWHAYG